MAKVKPQRIQRKRTKGWRMPPNTVYVGRPSKWGNPFLAFWLNVQGGAPAVARARAASAFANGLFAPQASKPVVGFETVYAAMDCIKRDIGELRGKTLACWCPLDQPCHADALLELANHEKAQPEAEKPCET